MKLIEVSPLTVLYRPFDAHSVSSDNYHYYSTIRSAEAVAKMNVLTRHHLKQNEFLLLTIMGGTYLEHGTSLDQLEPLAFFHSAFSCGDVSAGADALADSLVNMTKKELPHELRSLIYGQAPFWRQKYAGMKILLCRKTAMLPDRLLGESMPIFHLPQMEKASKIVIYQESSGSVAMMA